MGKWSDPDYMKKYNDARKHEMSLYGRRRHLMRSYGMTLEDFHAMWVKQSGLCGICSCILEAGTVNGVHIDHDHDTMKVRGLLCAKCNRGLGQFSDSAEKLESAAEYIRNKGVV